MDFPKVNKIDWYPGAWLAGTRGMSPQAKGLYIDLICWQLDGHPIPADTHMVSAITAVPLEVVDACWSELLTKMTPTEEGYYNLRAHTEAIRREVYCASRRKSSLAAYSNGNGKKHKAKPKPKATRRQAKFVKPAVDQLKAYIDEKKYDVDAEAFFDYHERNGWVTGKACQPMKDWKACIRTWDRLARQRKGKTTGREKRNDDAVAGFKTLFTPEAPPKPIDQRTFPAWDGKLDGDT
jgi:hypothetical protein